MKRLSFVTIMTLVGAMLYAAPVSQEKARQLAMQFMTARTQGAATKGMRLAKQQPRLNAAEVSAAAYYVFNVDDNSGFVIVSGDDRTPAILGYANSGSFDAVAMPDNMKAWLKGYEEQLKWLDNGTANAAPSLTATFSAPQKSPSVRVSVAPLITTTWNQKKPYNEQLLDTAVYKTEVVTGCVATAMAQMMNYHAQRTGQPDSVLADIPGYISKRFRFRLDTIPAGTRIDWANMLDAYVPGAIIESEEQQQQVDAVTNLMRICGTAVKMDYGEVVSSADSRDVLEALLAYFGYSPNMRILGREDFSLADWSQLILDELMQERPVMLSGSSSGGGHTFLVDGFDGDERFHINWGWGGYCDGYYLLGLANPLYKDGVGAGDSYDGYAMRQVAITGVQPDMGDSIVIDEKLQLTFRDVYVDENRLYFTAWNKNTKAAAFQFAVARIADDGKLTLLSRATSTNEMPYNSYIPKMSYGLFSSVEGTDKLVLVSRVLGTDEWLTTMNAENYYVERKVESGVMTLTLVQPTPALTLLSLKPDGTPKQGKKQMVEAVVSNSGDEFYGDLKFITQVADTIPAEICTVGASLPNGQTQTLLFTFEPKFEGRYSVVIETDEHTPVVIYNDSIDVEAANPASNAVNLKIEMAIANLNADGTAILGNKGHMVTIVTNDTDTDYVGLLFTTLATAGETFSYDLIDKRIEANSTIVIEEEFDVVMGKEYIPMCITDIPGQKYIYQSPRIYYSVAPAVTYYKTDGTHQTYEATEEITVADDVVAVDLVGNSITTTVTPSTNPNCLYFLSDERETPDGLGINVVKGTRADSIRIYDSALPFKPITDFTADTICYVRSFDSGVTATVREEGDTIVSPVWTTVCLPFDAERCLLADTLQVEWLSERNDSTYNFWLMRFCGDEHNVLYFSPAETFSAYTPYLMAVPGAGLKGYSDMTAAPVTFCGHAAKLRAAETACIAASSSFKFVGTMGNVSDSDRAYTISADGTRCSRDNVVVAPFRAYVKASSNVSTPNIVSVNISPAITVEPEQKEEPPVTKPGDVNNDGSVDVADISAVISFMSGDTAGLKKESCDVNNDGSVDVADISSIISIMAGE